MVVAAAATRVLPHPYNFAPITAMALFGGATFAARWQAVVVPFAAMFLSDCALEVAYRYGLSSSWGFHSGWWVVYGAFALILGIGFLLRERRRAGTIALATVASSVLFFAITNFATWAAGSLYSRTAEGLVQCFVMAIPFFPNTLLGDVFYSTVLFGSLALAEARIPQLRPQASPVRF
jgi:hypothetical protein